MYKSLRNKKKYQELLWNKIDHKTTYLKEVLVCQTFKSETEKMNF